MTATTRAFVLFLSLVAITGLQAKPTAPDWVTAVAAKPASFDYGKANAAVLLDESNVDVDFSGVYTTRTRWIVRIISKDGKENAVAVVHYNKGSHKVKSLQAWLIKPKGEVTTFGKKETIDAAIQDNMQLYSEGRKMIITAEDESDAGCVFAFEAVVEDKTVHTNQTWWFQSSLPVEYSAITYNLPSGWNIEDRTFNHDPITPVVNGRSLIWSLRNLPAVKNDPFGPPAHVTKACLGLSLKPPAGAKTIRQPFSGWTDISTFYSAKYDTTSTPDAAINAKAASLVANAKTLWDRLYQLCRQAQKVNYISIFMNSAAAGGYIPRDATKVLQSNYGDCKDKASFLRALLRAQGIESFPLIVNSGGGRYINADWPSPDQFNHAILAIKVDDSINTPAVMTHPVLGRLLIFDATNSNTPPGLLPEEDCGGRGLLVAGDKGELITLPEMRPGDNLTERKVTANLHADGSIDGTIEENFHGLASTGARREFRNLSPVDYRKKIERGINDFMPVARLTKIEPTDNFDKAEFSLTAQFTAPTHGKLMRDTLLIFKPVLVARASSHSFKKEKRTQPVVIEPAAFSEKSRIELPTEFHIDELPGAVELKSSFGKYSARVTADGARHILVERTLELSLATIPAADYESVRSFFEKVIQAEQAPVVLRKN